MTTVKVANAKKKKVVKGVYLDEDVVEIVEKEAYTSTRSFTGQLSHIIKEWAEMKKANKK
jgi:hypothetical protein